MLPERAGVRSIIRFSPGELRVMWVSLTGKDAEILTEIADQEVVPYFERQEGVASVTIEGGEEREIQLILDKEQMEQYAVSPHVIAQSLNEANSSASVGTVDKGNQDLHYQRFQQRRNRSEEHTSELQSRGHLVCRLLLETKKAESASEVPGH